jgi:hypothetical protein
MQPVVVLHRLKLGLIWLVETDDAYPGIASPQEALRYFPPFRDDDGTIFGAVDINCPDCDAVFSSSYDRT